MNLHDFETFDVELLSDTDDSITTHTAYHFTATTSLHLSNTFWFVLWFPPNAVKSFGLSRTPKFRKEELYSVHSPGELYMNCTQSGKKDTPLGTNCTQPGRNFSQPGRNCTQPGKNCTPPGDEPYAARYELYAVWDELQKET